LESLGISFAANSPIAAKPGHGLQDPTNGALFCDGVLFTNAVDKGDVLDSFLGNLVFGSALAELAANKGCMPAGLPPAIYFADDRPEVRAISSSSINANAAACGSLGVQNVLSVQHGVRVAGLLDVPVLAFHFTGAPEAQGPEELHAGDALLAYQVRQSQAAARARVCSRSLACCLLPALRRMRAQIDEFLLYGVVRSDEEARRALCMPNKAVTTAAAATFKIFGVELW
jgi:hypothetical protein